MKSIKIGLVLLALCAAPAAFGWGYYGYGNGYYGNSYYGNSYYGNGYYGYGCGYDCGCNSCYSYGNNAYWG